MRTCMPQSFNVFVGIDGFLGVVLVILEIKLDLVSVDTAVSVDLINSDLCAVLNCETIYSSPRL